MDNIYWCYLWLKKKIFAVILPWLSDEWQPSFLKCAVQQRSLSIAPSTAYSIYTVVYVLQYPSFKYVYYIRYYLSWPQRFSIQYVSQQYSTVHCSTVQLVPCCCVQRHGTVLYSDTAHCTVLFYLYCTVLYQTDLYLLHVIPVEG